MRQSVLIAVTGAASVWAGVNQWTGLGPEGGSIQMLALDPRNPGTIYAARYAGSTFKSTDGGMHWAHTDFPPGPVTIDPRDSGTLYVARGRGILKSTDAGTTWRTVNAGLPDGEYVSSLAIDPQSPRTVYASVDLAIFKSTDGAQNWSAVSSLSEDDCECVLFLAIHPQDSNTLYAAELDGVGGQVPRLYRSSDGGGSWSRIPAAEDVYSGGALLIDPRNPTTMYAVACRSSTGFDEGCGFWTIFKSTDGGDNWTPANSGLPDRGWISSLVIDSQNPNTLYVASGIGGVFKTTDGGGNWSQVNVGLTAYSLAIDSQNSLYAGTGSGVWKSTDGGANWRPVNSGLIATDISVLAIDPASPNTIYAVDAELEGARDVLKSTDAGASWIAVTLEPPAHISSLTLDPLNAGTLYAVAGTGILKSTDGGRSWNAANSGLEGPALALALDPSHLGTAYASTGMNVTGLGIFETTNGAASWRYIGPGPASHPGGGAAPVQMLAIDPRNPRTIYALCGTAFGQLFKSTDAGVSFSPANSGLPAIPDGGTARTWAIRAFAVDPQNSDTLYAWTIGSDGRLFKSTNGGADWEAASPGLPDGVEITSLAIHPRNTSTLYAATSSGVFRSTDGGANWSARNDGLTGLRVNALVIDPRNTGTVYAGTAGGGVFAITVLD